MVLFISMIDPIFFIDDYIRSSFSYWSNRVTNNGKEWFPHCSTTGVAAMLAATYFSLSTSTFIAGSAFLTGGLAFAVTKISTNLIDDKRGKIFLAITSTVALSYIASVPLIFVAASSVFGWMMDIGYNSFLNENVKNFLNKNVVYPLFSGCVGGLGVGIFVQFPPWIFFLCGKAMTIRSAIGAGVLNFTMTCIAIKSIGYLINCLVRNNLWPQELSRTWTCIGLSVVIASLISPYPVFFNIFTIVLSSSVYIDFTRKDK